ncbi:hypothetical protein GCM10011380_23480 [Sphingomonas metalli]|uniref:Uncharacterized protein n=1 Tax=Sphingomonas metalli TaxID=1779358 RepID=A0A916WVJ2_9SPHN|nr:hypothetical protein [Sphingomonas metalli]GGB33327.1 hypothetical protein GCM10011380_23480 [Sphingomonas metalli]
MNLLLLLSALFSALSGLGAGARAPAAVQTVAEASVARPAARPARPALSVRPVAERPRLAMSAVMPRIVAQPVVATVPLWASRRRE